MWRGQEIRCRQARGALLAIPEWSAEGLLYNGSKSRISKFWRIDTTMSARQFSISWKSENLYLRAPWRPRILLKRPETFCKLQRTKLPVGMMARAKLELGAVRLEFRLECAESDEFGAFWCKTPITFFVKVQRRKVDWGMCAEFDSAPEKIGLGTRSLVLDPLVAGSAENSVLEKCAPESNENSTKRLEMRPNVRRLRFGTLM